MTIQLPADLGNAVAGEARRLGTTPERYVEQALRQQLSANSVAPAKPGEPCDDFETWLRSIARPCGVSLSDEALSSEGLYD